MGLRTELFTRERYSLKVREHAEGGAGGKTCPFPRTFCGKEKKMFATKFCSYIHVRIKEGITVAEKMQ